jgi:hypothetical protein
VSAGVERAVCAAPERVAARARANGLSAEVVDNAVTVRGRALARRLVEEPALGRWGGVR